VGSNPISRSKIAQSLRVVSRRLTERAAHLVDQVLLACTAEILPEASQRIGPPRWPHRDGHRHPAFWRRAEPERALPHAGGRRGLRERAGRLALFRSRQSADRGGSRHPSGCHSSAYRLQPLERLEKLAALIARPYVNLIVYHGALVPNAKWRSEVVVFGWPQLERPSSAATPKKAVASHYRIWAC
jgi:hypothetical protein